MLIQGPVEFEYQELVVGRRGRDTGPILVISILLFAAYGTDLPHSDAACVF